MRKEKNEHEMEFDWYIYRIYEGLGKVLLAAKKEYNKSVEAWKAAGRTCKITEIESTRWDKLVKEFINAKKIRLVAEKICLEIEKNMKRQKRYGKMK